MDMPRDKKATNYGKDLINDRRASARLILGPKNLGTKWDGGGIRCLPFCRHQYLVRDARPRNFCYILIDSRFGFLEVYKIFFFVVKGRLEILRKFVQF